MCAGVCVCDEVVRQGMCACVRICVKVCVRDRKSERTRER